jgi:hypothetical protein
VANNDVAGIGEELRGRNAAVVIDGLAHQIEAARTE